MLYEFCHIQKQQCKLHSRYESAAKHLRKKLKAVRIRQNVLDAKKILGTLAVKTVVLLLVSQYRVAKPLRNCNNTQFEKLKFIYLFIYFKIIGPSVSNHNLKFYINAGASHYLPM
jgi:hypothetical protein